MNWNTYLWILINMTIASMKTGFGQRMPLPGTELMSRTEWGARPPTLVEHFPMPAPYVVIHHTYLPPACFTMADCCAAMRSMQDFHQIERGWNDIGYSFVVGGDGRIYAGRGFGVVGAHAPKYNDKSVGISLIGDWQVDLPPPQMLAATKELIDFGVAKGYIDVNYKLIGHRQVRDTECPGGRLYEEISKWSHFDPMIKFSPNTTENEVKKA